MTIITERIAKIESIALKSGAHDDIAHGACVMEAVAFVAGEPWTDHPACACPAIGSFLRNWNDNLPDDKRNELLRPLVPRLVGTRGSKALEHRRALMCADWLVCVNTPAWLRLANLDAHADALASLPEITDMAQVPSIRPALGAAAAAADAAVAAAGTAAADAARAAAGDAAWEAAADAAVAAAGTAAWAAARAAGADAAWDAAGAAARAAARAAAWDAARAAAADAAWDAAADAARAAAADAAWDAAYEAAARAAAADAAWEAAADAAAAAAADAAWDAAAAAAGAAAADSAWAAARAALAPTVEHLQQSALDLVNRMIEVAD